MTVVKAKEMKQEPQLEMERNPIKVPVIKGWFFLRLKIKNKKVNKGW